jgi:hypothetical protein
MGTGTATVTGTTRWEVTDCFRMAEVERSVFRVSMRFW